jgi:hypothetical protein
MNAPDPEKQWEARRARRYGSEHVGWFRTQNDARAYAIQDIAEHGNQGMIESTINRTVYYTVYDDRDL